MREMNERKEKIKKLIVQINTMGGISSTGNSQEYTDPRTSHFPSQSISSGPWILAPSRQLEIIHFTCAE